MSNANPVGSDSEKHPWPAKIMAKVKVVWSEIIVFWGEAFSMWPGMVVMWPRMKGNRNFRIVVLAHVVGFSILAATLVIVLLIGGFLVANKSVFEVATGAGAIYVAAWTVGLLYWRTRNGDRLLEHSRVAELAARFQRASDLLASEKCAPRVAGVVLLQDIGLLNAAEYHNVVLNLLIVFAEEQTKTNWDAYEQLREMRPESRRGADEWETAFARTPEDVMAAVRAIGKLRATDGAREVERAWLGDARLRFRRVILSNCTIMEASFDRMVVENACFYAVIFEQCNLAGTEVSKLNVIDACMFVKCNMEGVSMEVTDRPVTEMGKKKRLHFISSNIDRAKLALGDLRGFAGDCDIEGTSASGADLKGQLAKVKPMPQNRLLPRTPGFG